MEASPKTIAVTGATGLIGRAVCESLSARGYEIRALTRRNDASLAALPGVRTFRCDLPDCIEPDSLNGCGAVIHAAYVTRARSKATAQRINETGTRRLLQRSRDAGVPRFIFVSTTSAHENARSYYGQSKFRLENALDPQRDLIIRPGLVLSDAAGLFARMSRGGGRTWFIPLFRGGCQPMQTIHIDDLCKGFQLAIERNETGALTLAAPEDTTVRDFFLAVSERTGRRARFVPLPVAPSLLAFRIAEAVGIRLPVTSDNLLGLVHLRYWDTAPDLRRIGLTPRFVKESLASLRLR